MIASKCVTYWGPLSFTTLHFAKPVDDEVFAFIEAKMVRKYRKAPVRITDKFVPPNESDDDLMEEEEED
jgi:hypothetical protein